MVVWVIILYCTFVLQMIFYKTLTDPELIEQLKKDDESAFAEIYTRYVERLTDFASSRLFNLDDARDIIHDLFVKLWQERKELEITSGLKAYLFSLSRYHIIDKIRKNITREKYAAMIQALDITYAPDTDQLIAAKELQQIIDNSLNGLSPRVKEIYRLSREEYLSISEIAVKLQLSEQTVKNQLTSALKHLKQSLPLLSVTALVTLVFS